VKGMTLSIVVWFTTSIFISFVAFSLLGKRLEVFSSDFIKKRRFLTLFPVKYSMYFTIGLIWFLGKIHLPGLETLVTYSFDNRVGYVLRAAYWKSRVRKLGKNVLIEVGAKAINWQNITIEDNSWIDRNVLLIAGGGEPPGYKGPYHYKRNKFFRGRRGELIIGRGCHIAPNVVIQAIEGVEIGDYSGIAAGAKIYSLSHHYRNIKCNDGVIYKFTPLAPPEEQSLIGSPVVLEGNNAIGLNSVILPGVTVGKNSWVGVMSYVVEDIPPNSIAIGCPAKVIKRRNIKE
jgi:acetyltransferase-like isoleucine patch superfamily enzyme